MAHGLRVGNVFTRRRQSTTIILYTPGIRARRRASSRRAGNPEVCAEVAVPSLASTHRAREIDYMPLIFSEADLACITA